MRLPEPTLASTWNTNAQWHVALVCLGFALLGLFWLFASTVRSMVDIWNASETYTHGYLILPISLWLIWKKRHELIPLDPSPAYSALGILLLALAAWAIARITSVLVVEQFAFVALVAVCVWLILGFGVAAKLAFPLLFLFLSVPMGQDLVPPLMNFTADFTVKMLEITGIPVYRQGLYFEVPTGRWSVVEACSGIRYLIASVTLGLLYAYLVFRSFWRRLFFILLAILVPVLANGLRAYFIVLLGHFSDMRLAVGVDHLVYGWVFFGIVTALLFWFGSLWGEIEEDPRSAGSVESSKGSGSTASLVVASLMVLVVAYPVSTQVQAFVDQERQLREHVDLPETVKGWAGINTQIPEWGPYVENPAHETFGTYQNQNAQVSLFIAMFPKQQKESEAISSMNQLIDPRAKGWKILRRQRRILAEVDMNVAVTDVEQVTDGAVPKAFRIWDWYRIGAFHEAHPYIGKLREVQNFLLDGRTDGAFITVATPLSLDIEAADATLERFVRDMLPTINQTIDQSVFGNLDLNSR